MAGDEDCERIVAAGGASRSDGAGAAEARAFLDRMWDTALDRFAALAEETR